MPEFGALALLPIAVILVVAVATRRTLFALLCGTVAGALILGGWGGFDVWVEYTGKALSNETAQWLLLIVALFGILMMLFEKSGIVTDFARWVERFVTSRRKSTLLTFLLSIVLFVDDYLNVLTTGTSMKQVTDRYRVPRTQLGAIMKMTAAPIAVLVPVSTWALFFSGLFEAQGVTVGGSGFGAYLQSIPFIFFGWAAIAVALLMSIGWLPKLGLIKKDALRAERDGDVFPLGTTDAERRAEGAALLSELRADDADGSTAQRVAVALETTTDTARKPQPWSFLIAMAVLVGVTIATDANVVAGTAAALAVTVVLVLVQRRLSVRGVLDAALEGIESMLFVMVLTVLAFMVQEMNIALQLAEFVIQVTEPVLTPALLPAIVFAVCGVYAYATGSFWDLAAVITPVVLPLALALGADPILAGAAVFSGAALGSTTCLYGDGIILASRSIGIKPINLMLAILPYAGIAAGLSLVLYLVTGFVAA
ncbi:MULTISPECIES: Na+/H+ antiporter NhaC family protein [Microbacterium]|uniref:TRAP transporter large permease subunit n=1 Tax=Microbacterium sufflavum TaxID=2851649 RepID=A0ABY4ICF2_9MICO|nr:MULTISPECIES: Na+/H+ antiporter NhaC family protein [Microbacterium]MCK2025362.1 TRAP transporter large permease subunit [Microbacterium sufflavum]UPL10244.1 TRAP transporter large permease subunit [Microbacterium sufflavum]